MSTPPRPEERVAEVGAGHPEERVPSPGGSLGAPGSVELPRKRKGDVDMRPEPRDSDERGVDEELSRSESEEQQAKIKCFRKPHHQIEKQRRDKMNTLIDELSTLIPSCQPEPRKVDKLTVLRKAVQYLKVLRVGTSSTLTERSSKPSILPYDELRQLLLRAADGFLLAVTCERAKILFISESVSKILNFSRAELTGQSLFDFLHHKDVPKVKEQLASSSQTLPPQHLTHSATPDPPHPEASARTSCMSTGARRSFFCRMKHSRVTALASTSKKKDSYRYCTLHCTGYIGSWQSSDLNPDSESETSPVSCLVTVCRLRPHPSHPEKRLQPHPSHHCNENQPDPSLHENDLVNTKPSAFITRCTIDGKFTFIDQQATTVIGYLPQEVLGTSWYEYFHQEDLKHLAEKHREVLRSKEKIETQCYRFKTKFGLYVCLQSQWFSFTNPWTKEIDFIVSSNRVVEGSSHCKEEEALPDKELPIIPGLSSGKGTMIYAGSIGTQIANEVLDSYRINSPSSGLSSPVFLQEKLPVVSPNTSKSSAGSMESQATAGTSGSSETAGESSQLDEEVVPGLSSFSSDEAAMAVIMSLLETDTTIGQSGDFHHLEWPF